MNGEEPKDDLNAIVRAQGLGNVDDENAGRPDIKGICRTCSRSTITTRGEVEHRVTAVYCNALERFVPHDIVECNTYWRRGQMSIDDMQEIALVIDKRKGPPTGGYA